MSSTPFPTNTNNTNIERVNGTEVTNVPVELKTTITVPVSIAATVPVSNNEPAGRTRYVSTTTERTSTGISGIRNGIAAGIYKVTIHAAFQTYDTTGGSFSASQVGVSNGSSNSPSPTYGVAAFNLGASGANGSSNASYEGIFQITSSYSYINLRVITLTGGGGKISATVSLEKIN